MQTSSVHTTLPELSDRNAGGGVFPATLDIKGKNADLEVRTELINELAKPQEVLLNTVVENAALEELITVSNRINLVPGQTQQIVQKISLENVRFWHPDDPYLHYIRTDVVVNNQLVDSLRTRMGIKLFEIGKDQDIMDLRSKID